jgi:hypothetical protein
MSSWKDLIVNTIKLSEDVKRLNEETKKIDSDLNGVDKRLVRIEALVEFTALNAKQIEGNE